MAWQGTIRITASVDYHFEVDELWEAEDAEDAERMAKYEFWDYVARGDIRFGNGDDIFVEVNENT